jgi:hypothetical protein
LQPKIPTFDISTAQVPGTFLHAREGYTSKNFFPYGNAEEEAIIAQGRAWVFGCVEYSDVFGSRHRAGYCRWVNPAVSNGKNNLVFDAVSARYNYDMDIDEDGQPRQ